jgi:hypothetical protein
MIAPRALVQKKKTIAELTEQIKANGVSVVELPKNALAYKAAEGIEMLKNGGYELPDKITSHSFENNAALAYAGNGGIGLSTKRVSEVDIERSVSNGWLSQDNIILHEHAHNLHRKSAGDLFDTYRSWGYPSQHKPIAAKISKYATSNPVEFVAETFAAHVSGKSIPQDALELYKRFRGPELK